MPCLKKHFAPGGSASMAYCKFNSDVLSSSNLKDIEQYCKDNEINSIKVESLWSACAWCYRFVKDGIYN